MERPKALQIKKRYEKQWLQMAGVTAVGIGLYNNDTAIIVSVVDNKDKVREQIPSVIKGIPIKIEVSGSINAQKNK